MRERSAHARAWLSRRPLWILLTAAVMPFALSGLAAAEETPTPTETAIVEPTATETPEPEPTRTPRPTPTATPTPLPAQDLSVTFFNNFCEAGQPLLATVFNTSATPLENQTVRLTLLGEAGILEEHDHQLSLPPYGTVNLPLFNPPTPPWVKVEVRLITGPADPNPNNDAAICGVAAIATETPEAEPGQTPDAPGGTGLAPGSSSRAAPPPASGMGTDPVWRQPPAPTEPPPTLVATLAPPRAAQPIANGPQPSLTPIGDAGGGLAPEPAAAFPSRTLLMTGVVLLAAGSSWAFYYLTRPPKNA